MNSTTLVRGARLVLCFIAISIILLLSFIWESVAHPATEDSSLSEEDGTVLTTCRSSSCELKKCVY